MLAPERRPQSAGRTASQWDLEAAARALAKAAIDRGSTDNVSVVLVLLAAIVAVTTSEFTSNTASANIVVPVAIALGRATDSDPLVAALAATFAASLGFMMPVSTPCNAIVYGSGRIPLKSMMAAGLILDLVGVATIFTAMLLLGGRV